MYPPIGGLIMPGGPGNPPTVTGQQHNDACWCFVTLQFNIKSKARPLTIVVIAEGGGAER